MTLTSNETTWITTAVLIIHGSVIAWIMIKIQHAKDKDTAIKEIKKSVNHFILHAGVVFASVELCLQFVSSAPITRSDVFTIIFSFSILLSSVLLKMMEGLNKMAIAHLKQFEIAKLQSARSAQHMKMLKQVVDTLKK
jgi:hypothetical protein